MVRKITFWNLITLTLIFLVSIFGMYFINYPMKFNLFETLKDIEWKNLLLLIVGMIALSLIFAMFPFKNLTYGSKFQKILLFFSVLMLLYAFYFTISTLIKNVLELNKVENEYIEQAKKDIKNGEVTFKYVGGFTVPEYDKKTYSKIDSIKKNYGIKYQNTGGIIDYKEIEARKQYDNFVQPYLEKKNWEAKMDAEIQNLKRDYR